MSRPRAGGFRLGVTAKDELFMRSIFDTFGLGIFAAALAASLAGCGPKTEEAPCTDADCLAGNVCAGAPATCHLVCAVHADCPNGWECGSLAREGGQGGVASVCVEAVVPRTPGGYGTSCGLELDSACTESGFVCLGTAGDTEAQCSKLDGCTADDQCPAGYWCGAVRARQCVGAAKCTSDDGCKTADGFHCKQVAADGTKRCVNERYCHTSPDDCGTGYTCQNVVSTESTGPEFVNARACVARTYCTPCSVDADCGTATGACIDPKGDGKKFCSVQCSPTGVTCDTGSTCTETNGDFYCVPKSGSCASDGASCAPCRNDLDCGDGAYCVQYPASGERWCMAKCEGSSKCPNTPSGDTQECCTDAKNCGYALNRCQPTPHIGVTNPRYSFGCWNVPCANDLDCDSAAGETCDPTDSICVR